MTKFLNQRLLKDVLGFIALLVLTAMGCGMQNVCRRRGREESEDDDNSSFGYSVAISNTLFREAETAGVGSGGRGSMPPCMNCVLIEMGEMVCYTEKCPDCGRIPPGRRKKPKERFKRFRKLSTRKNGQKLRQQQPPDPRRAGGGHQQQQQELLVAALHDRDASSSSDHFSERMERERDRGDRGQYSGYTDFQPYRGHNSSVV